MINISKPMIGEAEKRAVLKVLNSGILAQGPVVQQFETAFAKYCGVKYAVATSSGTTALHLALLAHGIGPGDEVITSPFTFIATANAIHYVGATPVFADIDPRTFNLDPESIKKSISPRTRAIIPVHLFGLAADMDQIGDIAVQKSLVLIEDACQAHGAEWNKKKVGSFGTGCFSFYPSKNMTTGEGGMLTTNDSAIAEKAQVLRNQGMKTRYYYTDLGFNYRMTDIHAAIGLTQLFKLESFIKKRIHNALFLCEKLHKYVLCPLVPEKARHVFNQYTIQTDARDKLLYDLQAHGIGTGVYYPLPVHKQTLFSKTSSLQMPVAEGLCQKVLSLPVHPGLRQQELDTIVSKVIESCERK